MSEVKEGWGFDEAILSLKAGYRVTRSGWNGKDIFLKKQGPNKNSKMTAPYIYMKNDQKELAPYTLTDADLLANDWEFVEG